MKTMKSKLLGTALVAIGLCFVLALPALAQAPDATGRGPFDTTNAEYKFPATVDPDVIAGRMTELWARVYRPVDLTQGPYALVVFLHGNHNTCGHIDSTPPYPPGLRIDDDATYTFTGTCPASSPIVTPNHAGYEYLADQLASWGYIVVSVNANRGINAAGGIAGDAGLNLTRGRLVLKHMQRLHEWNTVGGAPDSLGVGPNGLIGTMDFSQVGLMGHSRGGEGVRAAYNQYRDAGSPWPARIGPATFRGIFEIGPVDGQTSRILNADGVAWNVLLPMCDGDVFNLQGVKPFDRMMRIFTDNPATQKSTYAVWGANHNFFNTEWQLSDSDGCVGNGNNALFPTFFLGSDDQRQTSLASLMAFFRGNVGVNADPSFNDNFNPLVALPDVVSSITRVDRGFVPSPNAAATAVFEDFDQPTGTNSSGQANNAVGISIVHRNGIPQHDASQRTAFISWRATGGLFQANWTAPGSGKDVSGYDTLDFRISRECFIPDDGNCVRISDLNDPLGATNFSISLVLADGSLSTPVELTDALAPSMDLSGPVGAFFTNFGSVLHPILQTARVQLGNFGCDLSQVHGVRFTFDDTPTGSIYLGNVRFTKGGLPSGDAGPALPPVASNGSLRGAAHGVPAGPTGDIVDGNSLAVQAVASVAELGNEPGVEIVVTSNVAFSTRDELAVLRVGDQNFTLSGYPESGDTHTLIFRLTSDEFGQIPDGAQAVVQYGLSDEQPVRWLFGPLSKSSANH